MSIPNIADRLKELRKNKNITQQEMADTMGVSRVTAGSYERGSVIPQTETLIKVAQKYDVSMDWLCGIEEEKGKNGDLKTYADLLVIVSKLRNSFDDITYEDTIDEESYNFLSIWTPYTKNDYDWSYETNICIRDHDFYDVVMDYNTMYDLYKKGTISEKIFNEWFDGKIKELSSKPLPKLNEDLDIFSFDLSGFADMIEDGDD